MKLLSYRQAMDKYSNSIYATHNIKEINGDDYDIHYEEDKNKELLTICLLKNEKEVLLKRDYKFKSKDLLEEEKLYNNSIKDFKNNLDNYIKALEINKEFPKIEFPN